MRSALVLDGRFRVTDKGEVFRQKNGGEYPATVTCAGKTPRVTYYDGSNNRFFSIAQLVYMGFVGTIDPGYEVSHLDGNPSNNRLSNLFIETRAERAARLSNDGVFVRRRRNNHARPTPKEATPCQPGNLS